MENLLINDDDIRGILEESDDESYVDESGKLTM